MNRKYSTFGQFVYLTNDEENYIDNYTNLTEKILKQKNKI